MPDLLLRFLDGPRRGQESRFAGPLVRIGRSRDNDLVLPEQDSSPASARHAEAMFERGRWWIADAGSMNGTYLNGVRVQRQRLRSGDRLMLGDAALAVRVAGSRAAVAWLGTLGAVTLGVVIALLAWRAGHDPGGGDWLVTLAGVAERSVYLVVVEDAAGRSIVGTAFAVRADGLLATNAHVARALSERRRPGGTLPGTGIAVLGDQALRVLEARIHPGWRPDGLQDDVALLRVAIDRPLIPLRLAGDGEVAALTPGTRVAAYGFPAAGTDAAAPHGRLSADIIGAMRGGRYMEVGLGIAPGTSGSPIFVANGSVVGIVVAGDFVPRADGKGTAPSGSGANWGLAVTALREMLGATR